MPVLMSEITPKESDIKALTKGENKMRYLADDGKVFDNAESCASHELRLKTREENKNKMIDEINSTLDKVFHLIEKFYDTYPEELNKNRFQFMTDDDDLATLIKQW